MTNYEIWQGVLAEFELSLSKANFTTWFTNTGIREFQDGHVVICVPNTFTQSWLEKKFHSEIVRALERVTGKRIKKIEYKVENIRNVEEKELVFESPTPPTPNHTSFTQKEREHSPFGLNNKHTFSTFVVGKNNELAYAASQAVASRPGDAYNPLVIYGGVGLGKTHLLHAIAHGMIEKNPGTRVLYASMEKFMNEFINAVREGQGKAKEFKDRYRNIDLLLIDDIQFLAGKEGTQEEFFHTFNELHQQHKQLVITSDRPPKAIPALEDRLRSRLEWGLVTDIAQPDLETRVAILAKKCVERNYPLEHDILTLIASSVQENIRELEGALNKIIAYHELKNTEATKESVRPILASLENKSGRRSVTPKEVINAVCQYYDIGFEDMVGKSREKRVSLPRQIVMFLLRRELDMSYPSIGTELGGRDHTTAMHADSKIHRSLTDDAKIKQDIDLIKEKIYNQSLSAQ